MTWRRFQALLFGLSPSSFFKGYCRVEADKIEKKEEEDVVENPGVAERLFAAWGPSQGGVK